jgi:hypothetical protein
LVTGALRATVVMTSLIAGSLGAATHSWGKPVPVRQNPPAAVSKVAAAAPQLAKTPLRVMPDANATVVVTGQGFEPTLTMTLSNQFNVFTFGAQSLERVTATSFRFDANPVPDGTYLVTVRNGDGQKSNPVTLVVKRN